jgi:TolA-binding protein
MQNKVKLSKRQIKEDKFTAFMLESKQSFQENWQFWVIGLVAVILLFAGGSYYISSQQSQVSEAGAKYARAIMDYRQGNTQIAILTLDEVVEEYGSTPVADQAMFMLGKINFETKNYDEAIRYFNKYISDYGQTKLNVAAAYAGIGASYENQGDYAQAAEYYDKAVNANPAGPQAGDHLMSAMRVYLLQGDYQTAKTYLDRIEDEFAGTQLAQRASRYYAEQIRPAG